MLNLPAPRAAIYSRPAESPGDAFVSATVNRDAGLDVHEDESPQLYQDVQNCHDRASSLTCRSTADCKG